jgi:Flp pilus assembly protein TadG
MVRKYRTNNERGATFVEMAIGAAVFLTAMFGVIEFGRLLWTQNALTDAVRRGARYAALNTQNVNNIKNVVVYGVPSPPGGATPVVSNLTTSNVTVSYNNFGVKRGSVTVAITGYQFAFIVPLIGTTWNMGQYKTTLTGESAGYVPATI